MIEILDAATRDLIDGFHFYEEQGAGLGSYFLTKSYADIESLRIYCGIHSKPYKDYQRLLARRFPFAVFYKVAENSVRIYSPGLSPRSKLD